MLALHVSYVRTIQGAPTFLVLRDPAFSLAHDRGLAETVEYVKSAVTAAALYLVARTCGGRLFLGLAATHGWFLADNLLRLHERAGFLIGRLLAPNGALGLASRDIGQPMAFAVIGAALSAILWWGWRDAGPRQRRTGALLIPTAGSLMLFAVVADALHASRLGSVFGETFWLILEDGGETLVLTLNCALAVGVAAAAGVRIWPSEPAGYAGEG
jgi:hypothetical protein